MQSLKCVPLSNEIVNIRIQNAKGGAGYEPHVQQQEKRKYCLGH